MNLYNIENSFQEMKSRCWKRIYWFIDFHGTVAIADYGATHKMRTFYPHAKEVLQFISKRTDICTVLWTCSHRADVNYMYSWLEENGIKMDYINENPECHSDSRINVSQKPYYNVMLDDRAGFEPECDWEAIGLLLEKITGEIVLKKAVEE